jgi:murein DD-endopeptidase MepM/ murein hydrolase activator NlpD
MGIRITDAAFGAAKYLGANGGTVGSPDGSPGQQPKEGPSIRNAIWHYNHDDQYVERVFEAYKQFLAGSSPSTNAGCGGGLGIGADGFVFPLKATKSVIRWCHQSSTSCHGTPGKDFYNAADIHAPTGTPIVAAKPGTITKIGTSPLRYTIKGDDGLWYYYTHLLDGSSSGLTVGAHVDAGQVLGQVGNTADAEGTPPHLHFHVGPTAESLAVSRECVQSGSCRQNAALLVDPQPVLVQSFINLPE